MGRELKRMGAPFAQPYWSAKALMEGPQFVTQAHQNFIDSGAEIITVSNYAVVPHHIGQELYDKRGAELITLAAKIARNCADKSAGIRVAGSIPPVFGSYMPGNFDAGKADDLIHDHFKYQDPYVDFWLIETAGSFEEALTGCNIHHQFYSGKPLWLAFTLADDNEGQDDPLLFSGEKLSEVLEAILSEVSLDGLLFNCCQVEDVEPALKISTQTINKLGLAIELGAYANAFAPQDTRPSATSPKEFRKDISPDSYAGYAEKWADSGATIIGGCCGIGPDHVKVLAEQMSAYQSNKSS